MLEEIWEQSNLVRKKAAKTQTVQSIENEKRIDQHGFENKRSLLAQSDIVQGPNQPDNTFEILNSFLVNLASPFTAAWSR